MISSRTIRKRPVKIHTITGLIRGREFAGSFAAAGSSYRFVFSPSKGDVSGGKFRLQGKLTVTDAKGRSSAREGVQATLAGIQGGIGVAPVRPQLVRSSALSDQRPEAPSQPEAQRPLPELDSFGPASFVGVMYFHFDPLPARAFGVAADLTRVQFNARLAAFDDTARALHGIYSAIVEALDGQQPNPTDAAAYVDELNRVLAR